MSYPKKCFSKELQCNKCYGPEEYVPVCGSCTQHANRADLRSTLTPTETRHSSSRHLTAHGTRSSHFRYLVNNIRLCTSADRVRLNGAAARAYAGGGFNDYLHDLHEARERESKGAKSIGARLGRRQRARLRIFLACFPLSSRVPIASDCQGVLRNRNPLGAISNLVSQC